MILKFKLKCRILLITLFVVFLNYTSVALSLPEDKDFNSYWYNYGAEISRFELEQGRYGEIRPGHVVLIFVTEPFLPDIQVKSDFKASREKSIPILKLNLIKRLSHFTTSSVYSRLVSPLGPHATFLQLVLERLERLTTAGEGAG